MFDRMQRTLPPVGSPSSPRAISVPRAFERSGVNELFAELGGAGFAEGAYRIHDPTLVAQRTDLAVDAFPQLRNVLCFASDWLGRQFAVSADHSPKGRPGVLIIDVHWDEAAPISDDLEQFHDDLLAHNPERALALDRYGKWLAAGGAVPTSSQCVDFTVPLYLGGADDVTNMSINDMEVVWGIGAQLLRQVRELPEGTRLDIDIA